MNVAQLRELLKKYPDEMEVVGPVHSDYDAVSEDGISVLNLVNRGFYHMRPHSTMSAENRLLAKDCLCISGG